MAALLSAVLRLENLGHQEAAAAIEAAVAESIRDDAVTRDLGGELSTSEVGDRIAAALESVPVPG